MKVSTFLTCQMSIIRISSPTWMTDDLYMNPL